MEPKSYDTVTEAMADLKKQGYTIDFSILTEKQCLICHLTSTVLSPDDFEIDSFYRFEGDTDPGDQMIVYAISSKKNNLKGLVSTPTEFMQTILLQKLLKNWIRIWGIKELILFFLTIEKIMIHSCKRVRVLDNTFFKINLMFRTI